MQQNYVRTPPLSPAVGHALHAPELWFDPGFIPRSLPPEIRLNPKRSLHLSGKQVPSCLLLKSAGSRSVGAVADDLLTCGFPLEVVGANGGTRKVTTECETPSVFPTAASQVGSWLSGGMYPTSEDGGDINFADFASSLTGTDVPDGGPALPEIQEISAEEAAGLMHKGAKIAYQDPFTIFAGLALLRAQGKALPKVYNWGGDVLRLHDSLPARLHPDRGNRPNQRTQVNKFLFRDMHEEDQWDFLAHHTHWGYKLTTMCDPAAPEIDRNWARDLRRRLKAFIGGKPDPYWNTNRDRKVHDKDESSPSRKHRISRLFQTLLTIDGLFAQRFLAYPEEKWTWDRFDLFILGNLSIFISDEFYDGALTEYGLNLQSNYSILKEVRKLFKQHAHERKLCDLQEALNSKGYPRWVHQFYPLWELAEHETNITRYCRVIGILSQTRGAGKPPPMVVTQSKRKFLMTVSEIPVDLTDAEYKLVNLAFNEVLRDVPDFALTGLSTKAKYGITTAACIEHVRREGGTLMEMHTLCGQAVDGEEVPIRDLDTGQILYTAGIPELQDGEWVFWKCLDTVLKTPVHELNIVHAVVAEEPGKGRTVTKGSAALKIVLDVVSKLCASPLGKAFASSTAGMKKSNQGWEFFKGLFYGNFEKKLFRKRTGYATRTTSYSLERTEYHTAFVSSTDYSTATDYMHPEIRSILGDGWMTKVGIPPVLRGIVGATCFSDRVVHFYAKGALKEYGDVVDSSTNLYSVPMYRGILMGDPLTKVILHLVNITVRKMTNCILEGKFRNEFADGHEFLNKIHSAFL